MENEKKTPPRFIENLAVGLREEISRRSQAHASPFRCLPNVSTPPSRFVKIKNPFEAGLNERLHLHIFSPSVFAESKTSAGTRTSETFKWSIEDVASLRPAYIDEQTVHQLETSDPEDDVHVQAKIERYFSESHIVPSPWNDEPKTNGVVALAKETADDETREVRDAWTQTTLRLPPVLPAEVQAALAPYLTFTRDEELRDEMERNASFCRRLFNFHSEAETSIVSMSSELSSVVASPPTTEPTKRTFDARSRSTSPDDRLKDCRISPIIAATRAKSESPVLRRCLDFGDHMSVDSSQPNLAACERDEEEESPLRMSSNECEWDVEFNSVSLRRSLFGDGDEESSMDISDASAKSRRLRLQDDCKSALRSGGIYASTPTKECNEYDEIGYND